MAMKFEILVLNRRDGIICAEFADVPAVTSFILRIGRRAASYTIIALRGKEALRLEKIPNLTDLTKELTEFMVATANQQ